MALELEWRDCRLFRTHNDKAAPLKERLRQACVRLSVLNTCCHHSSSPTCFLRGGGFFLHVHVWRDVVALEDWAATSSPLSDSTWSSGGVYICTLSSPVSRQPVPQQHTRSGELVAKLKDIRGKDRLSKLRWISGNRKSPVSHGRRPNIDTEHKLQYLCTLVSQSRTIHPRAVTPLNKTKKHRR